jgi:hypothetical protein
MTIYLPTWGPLWVLFAILVVMVVRFELKYGIFNRNHCDSCDDLVDGVCKGCPYNRVVQEDRDY